MITQSATAPTPATRRRGWTSPPVRRRWSSSSRTRHARSRPEVLGGIGGFAGLFELKLDRWTEPVLASSTDGVGTKIAVAKALDKHDTVGIDLVAMVVDDLVVCGAEPLFLQDYIAVGKVVPERIAELVKGIAEGCVQAGCALLGGETAEHPGLMAVGDYDMSAHRCRRCRGGQAARPEPGAARRRGDRHGRPPACTPTATRWPGTCCWTWRSCRCPGTSRSSAGRWARNCSNRPGSTPRTASRWSPRPTCGRSPTSPAAAWPRTWPGCCPTDLTAVLDRRHLDAGARCSR